MIDRERQELRCFAAEDLMGWQLCYEVKEGHYCLPNEDSSVCHVQSSVEDWRPDDPTTGQVWMCWNQVRQTKDIVLGAKGKIHFCEIREKSYPVPMDNHYREADTPCDAILLAIRAAVTAGREGRDEPPSNS